MFFLIPLTILAGKTTSTTADSPSLTTDACLLITATHLPSFFNGIILSVSFLNSPHKTILLWLSTDWLRKFLLAARILISEVCLISG